MLPPASAHLLTGSGVHRASPTRFGCELDPLRVKARTTRVSSSVHTPASPTAARSGAYPPAPCGLGPLRTRALPYVHHAGPARCKRGTHLPAQTWPATNTGDPPRALPEPWPIAGKARAHEQCKGFCGPGLTRHSRWAGLQAQPSLLSAGTQPLWDSVGFMAPARQFFFIAH